MVAISYSCCTRLIVNASPARLTVVTDCGSPWIRRISCMIEGQVFTTFTCSRADMVARSSTLPGNITFPPQLKGTKISYTDRSKQIEVEANMPFNSSELNTSRAQYISAATLECRTPAPFGFPVEPEV